MIDALKFDDLTIDEIDPEVSGQALDQPDERWIDEYHDLTKLIPNYPDKQRLANVGLTSTTI